ncbi:endonuclease III-like protein 1 isoform X2 [Hypanus sabinus]|uniref:endonuclease III-like protein 1 isoform X2 n=1 Tax=Hypanus sabinus TaxID=79690 RepID=UPI0028C3845D|nr:endonuclease III-like protein 1 isoform X2 [Hypanus sabinus]
MAVSPYFTAGVLTRNMSRGTSGLGKGESLGSRLGRLALTRRGNCRDQEPDGTAAENQVAGTVRKHAPRRRRKRARIVGSSKQVDGEAKGEWEPEHWREQLDNIREMRKDRSAPVDHMGAEQCFDKTAAPENKVKYIKQTTAILKEQYGGDIPNTVSELLRLPGVGPKMAHLAMKLAWNVVSGICVDTHVHRITNRLQWLQKETRTPEETRLALEDWMPRDLWSETNWLLVGFGQQICLPVNPHCSGCLNRDICPAAKNSLGKTNRRLSPNSPPQPCQQQQ